MTLFDERSRAPRRPTRPLSLPSSLSMLSALSLLSLVACGKASPAADGAGQAGRAGAADAAPTHATKGTIKSFVGSDRKLVNIAHETIPGYMSAMTMTFAAGSPTQLDGLAAGDKVAFSFKDEAGKHVIVDIKKSP